MSRWVILGVGVVVVLVGLFAWSVEDSYGSGNFTIQPGPGNLVSVFEEDEDVSGDVGTDITPGRRAVFEGTSAEAREYMERRRATGESFVLPGAIVAVGSALIVLAFIRRRSSVSAMHEATGSRSRIRIQRRSMSPGD